MNKGLTYTLIGLLSFLLIFLVGIMIFLFNGKISFDGFRIASGYSTKLVEEKEISNIHDLDITTDMADVIVEEKDINNIKVELYSEKEPEYEITESASTINIVLKQKTKVHFGLFNKSPRVVVYVPKTFNKDIKIKGTTSDVKIGNLPESNLTVKATTGDVKVKQIQNSIINLTTGDIKIDNINDLDSETRTGDIKIKSVKTSKIITTTGDIKIEKSVNVIKAKTNTGDIKINDVNKSLDLSTNTGDVKIETATILSNSNITTGTGDVRIDSVTGCYVEGDTKVGDRDINNTDADRKSDIILNIKTRVGDIDVN